ncbi:DNA polymerase III subunit delta [Basilea psittacipulmonis]|uniref:DNA polymerase III subunit delta n=1 Tax=Basilea psittacipulmonis DSM 24701 TaxID=1072685 RepID=A0A077DBW6_9BURK|nr:DNA polymerase III subunit delta [Basilea psittacipulmonis]AIL32335.1 hypothetical protein IX83_02485 [Basilea psittacipulmonis DSM 24701]
MNSLTLSQLKQDKHPSIAPLYMIESDDLYLRTEAQDIIKQKAKQLGFTERHSFTFSGNSSWQDIWEHIDNISLFGEKKVIEIHVPGGKPGKSGISGIDRICKSIEHEQLRDICIILVFPKLDYATSKTEWVKKCQTYAVCLKIPVLTRNTFPSWLEQKLSEYGLSTSHEALEWLSDHLEGNSFAAAQEILKLSYLYPAGPLTIEQIQNAVLDVARYNVFDLIDAIHQRNPKRASKILLGLASEGEEPMSILGLLGKMIRDLHALHIAQQNRENLNDTFKRLRLFGASQTALSHMMQRLSFRATMISLNHVMDIELIIKGTHVKNRLNNPWMELNKLIIKLSQ